MSFAVRESQARTPNGNGPTLCEDLHTGIKTFARLLKAANIALAKQGAALPGRDLVLRMSAEFRDRILAFALAEPLLNPLETGFIRRSIQSQWGPWFWRCGCWNDSRFKPYGYAGDFRILETLYDLETHAGRDPTRSGMENLLAALCADLAGTRGLWERRKWLKTVLLEALHRKRGKLRVLDMAAGGARPIRDFLAEIPMPDRLEIWLYDQDPAAAAYRATIMPSLSNTLIRNVTKPLRKLGPEDFPGRFDVVICAGWFDYLENAPATRLLSALHAAKAPDGTLAITCSHAEDASRLARSWIMEWPLHYRTPEEAAALFPAGAEPVIEVSPEGAMILAKCGPAQAAPAAPQRGYVSRRALLGSD